MSSMNINDLPTEIISHIFLLGSAAEELEVWYDSSTLHRRRHHTGPFANYAMCSRRRKPFAQAVSPVCTRWKDVSDSISRLHVVRLGLSAYDDRGSRDMSNQLATLGDSVNSAKGCDMDIQLTLWRLAGEVETRLFFWGLQMIAPYYRQWRCVSVSVAEPLVSASLLLTTVLARAENLLWLSLDSLNSPYITPTETTYERATDLSLHMLGEARVDNAIKSLHTVAHIEAPLRSLGQANPGLKGNVTSLRMRDSEGDWSDFLMCMDLCKNCVSLDVTLVNITNFLTVDRVALGALVLQGLVSLHLEVMPMQMEVFLKMVGMLPALRHLYVQFSGEDTTAVPDALQPTSHFPRLETITIQGIAVHELPLCVAFTDTPSLKEFTLEFYVPAPGGDDNMHINIRTDEVGFLPTGSKLSIRGIPPAALRGTLYCTGYRSVEDLSLNLSSENPFPLFYPEMRDGPVVMEGVQRLHLTLPYGRPLEVFDEVGLPNLQYLRLEGEVWAQYGGAPLDFGPVGRQVFASITTLRVVLPMSVEASVPGGGVHPLAAFENLRELIVEDASERVLEWLVWRGDGGGGEEGRDNWGNATGRELLSWDLAASVPQSVSLLRAAEEETLVEDPDPEKESEPEQGHVRVISMRAQDHNYVDISGVRWLDGTTIGANALPKLSSLKLVLTIWSPDPRQWFNGVEGARLRRQVEKIMKSREEHGIPLASVDLYYCDLENHVLTLRGEN